LYKSREIALKATRVHFERKKYYIAFEKKAGKTNLIEVDRNQ